VLADEPDGRNINDGCGSTHLDNLISELSAGDYDLGFAFDGDGDRVLAVDRTGSVVEGDDDTSPGDFHGGSGLSAPRA